MGLLPWLEGKVRTEIQNTSGHLLMAKCDAFMSFLLIFCAPGAAEDFESTPPPNEQDPMSSSPARSSEPVKTVKGKSEFELSHLNSFGLLNFACSGGKGV